MWHWNSLWTRAPGDPPTLDDPMLWNLPWSLEQALALQARTWESLMGATQSWWSMALATWPVAPTWPVPAWTPETLNRVAMSAGEHQPTEHQPTPAATPARPKRPTRPTKPKR